MSAVEQRYLARDMDRPVLLEAPGGQAAVYTHRHPTAGRANQDCAAVYCSDEGHWAALVADGVGGGRGGGQASALAIEAVTSNIRDAKPGGFRPALLDGLEAANEQVLAMRLGAGATFAGATIVDGALRSYHVGDCMILVVGQRGRVKLHTVAHSPVGYGFASGYLDESEAMFAPYRHLILNMLGSPELRIEVGVPQPLAARDTVLVASDGLFDNLFVYEIIDLIRKGPLDLAAAALAEACRRRMVGEDSEDEESALPSKPDDLAFVLFRRR